MNQLSTEHYRDLLRSLTDAQADRLRATQELALLDAQQTSIVPRQNEEAIAALERQFVAAKADLEQRHTETNRLIEENYRAEESATVSESNRRAGEIELQYETDLDAAEQKYKEDSWLVQSILDDTSETSPKVQYERLKAHLTQARDYLAVQNTDVQELYDQAVSLVQGRMQSVGPVPAPETPPANREEAEQQIAQAVEALRRAYDRLAQQWLPRLFAGWLAAIGVFLLITVVLFGILFVTVPPAWLQSAKIDRNLWAAIAGGVGAIASLLFLVVCHQIAAGQVARALAPVQQHAVNARAWYQRWQKLAESEYRRTEQDYRTRYVNIVEKREKSLAQFTADYEARKQELESNHRQEVEALHQGRETALRNAGSEFSNKQQSEESSYRAALSTLERQYKEERQTLSRQQSQQQADYERRRQELYHRCETNWQETLHRVLTEAESLRQLSQEQFLPWNQILDSRWTPPEQVPPGVGFGQYQVQLPSQTVRLETVVQPITVDVPRFELPAALPFPEAPSLFLKASGSGRTEAVNMLQLAMLRYLTLLPPGDVRFTIFDPVGLGETFASFMHLADFDDLLITNRIWTEAAQIDEQLAKITEHMENVFQKYLRNEFESIEDYNHHAGEVAEPYRILIVADFPVGFSERAAQRLVSIATSGAKCGVHTLISVDMQQPLPRDFDLTRLEADATVLEWRAPRDAPGEFVNSRLGSVAKMTRDEIPAAAVMANLIRKVGELSKDTRRVEVPFFRIAPKPAAYWTADSRSEIEVPLGRAGATKLQYMKLGKGTSQHVLIAGKTGSGKSTLLHVVVTDLALRYSPDEIEFYLIDFKKGVEFKTYASHQLPHARVIAIESDREFGASVLERLDTILKERGDLFRDVGAQDIRSFRAARPDMCMPRIMLIVDEFQEFFIEDDKYSQTASLLLDRLVRQGRAFGMHVLLGSQTLGGAYSLARTTVGQMAVRIALQCSESDAHLILSENNGAARLLTRPGEAIYNNANGMVEGNSPFQVAWLDDGQRDGFLAQIEQLCHDRRRAWPAPIVFEGNLPADPARNPLLCELLSQSRLRPVVESAPRAWLGDAVALAGPSEVQFFPRSGANLLLVGQDSPAALGILSNCLVALSAQSVGRLELLTEVNGGVHLGSWSAILQPLKDRVHAVAMDSTSTVLADFAAEVTRRQQSPGEHAPWFLVIDDLSRYRDLRKSDDDYGFGGFDKNKTVSPSQLFTTLVKEGPAVGLHLIIWCDSYNNVDRWFSRQMLREFEMRAVFQMSAADSSNLIDNPAASRLGNNRAIVYSDERGTIEKFRPYGPPSEEWLAFWQTGVFPENAAIAAPDPGSQGRRATNGATAEDVPPALVPDRSSGNGVAKSSGALVDHSEPTPTPVQSMATSEPTSSPSQTSATVESRPTAEVVPLNSTAKEAVESLTPAATAENPDELEIADDLSSWNIV